MPLSARVKRFGPFSSEWVGPGPADVDRQVLVLLARVGLAIVTVNRRYGEGSSLRRAQAQLISARGQFLYRNPIY